MPEVDGIWDYQETDDSATESELLNLLGNSVRVKTNTLTDSITTLTTLVETSAWQTLTLPAGLTEILPVEWRVRSALIEVTGKLSIDAASSAGTSVTVGTTLPATGTALDDAGIAFDTTHKLVSINLDPSGILRIYIPVALSAGAQVSFTQKFRAA